MVRLPWVDPLPITGQNTPHMLMPMQMEMVTMPTNKAPGEPGA